MLQIEVVVNSRPLGVLYDDDIEQPLTPNHLLFGRKLKHINDVPDVDETNFGPRRVRYIETIIEHFWCRWSKEYVTSLRSWTQKVKRTNKLIPEVNDIVLVFDEKLPRQNWCLGRIVEIIPSTDGKVRGAKVLLGKTKMTIERPINKLYPVEFANEI